jgi:RNA polymerase sigma-70 factor, ECF subfamily
MLQGFENALSCDHDQTRAAVLTGQPREMFERLYGEIRALAERFLREERVGHTLQPTALAHEVFLRVCDQTRAAWGSDEHFLSVVARMLRRILIDHARARSALKRVAPRRATGPSDHGCDASERAWEDLRALDQTLDRLAGLHERQAQVVELRIFGGLTNEQVAAALGVSRGTVVNDWTAARAWLSAAMERGA